MLKYDGKYIQVLERNNWEYIERKNCNGIVGIVAITDQDKLVLIKQYREPIQEKIIEIPAGLAGDIKGQEYESLIVAAKRELLEETGYQAESMKFIGDFPLSPGISTEIMTLVKATQLTKINDGGGDESESIEVIEIPILQAPRQIIEWKLEGVSIDAKIFAALHFATVDLTFRLIQKHNPKI